MTDKTYDIQLSIGFGYTEAGADPDGTPECIGNIDVKRYEMKYCHVLGVEAALLNVLNALNASDAMKCKEDLPPVEVEKHRATMKDLQRRMEG